jgi:hypothetical protein
MVKRAIAVLACFMTLGVAQARADGVVENASKGAARGAVKGVQQELNTGTMIEGAKQVTKGMLDGVANAVPTVTSQIVKQSNVNRKQLGNVARTVTGEATSGLISSSARELQESLGKNGDGPLADTMAATSERVMAATVRGIVTEARIDPATAQNLAAAAMRGALSEVHFQIPVWTYLIAFLLGSFSTLLCGVGLMVLYMLFQRRRTEVVAAPVPAVHARPAYSPA